jgi:hypothetical protein
MRSEGGADRWAWLRSQGLGVLCGLATVALLAVGSFVVAATRDGASREVAMDDLTEFFRHPAPAHLWVYLLVPVVALYALNTLLATWWSVARKLRAGVRAPGAYAASVIHVGFLLAILGHGVGGLLGGERGETVLVQGGGWRPLPDGRSARLVSLEVEELPGGMPKRARVLLDVRDASGAVVAREVGYNAPLSDPLGVDLSLLSDMGQLAAAELTVAGVPCHAVEGTTCAAAGVELEVARVIPPGRIGRGGAVELHQGGRTLFAMEGRDAPLADGRPVRLAAVVPAPAVLLRSRHAPGHPFALAGALLLGAGLVMMARRFVPAKGKAADGEDLAEAA